MTRKFRALVSVFALSVKYQANGKSDPRTHTNLGID